MVFIFIIATLFASVLSLVLSGVPRVAKMVFFALLGFSGLTAIRVGLYVLMTQQSFAYQLNSSFPNITFQVLLDPLSSFFLIIIGLIVAIVALYGPSYVSQYEKHKSITSMSFFTGLFISGMYLVLLAHDVFTFMLAWEVMSISSYCLVLYNSELEGNRQTALIYMLMAQASGLLILFAFSTLVKATGSMSFDVMFNTEIASTWANIAFFLAFFGFSMKAGIVPLHVWLPKAYPIAPSHISALMSGVMLKVTIYGFIRFAFGLLKNISWQWGCVVLLFGVASALLGVLNALLQNNIKKLIAYSSIENAGIIFIGLGLSLIFVSQGYPLLAAIGLVAVLYHCLSHAIFKSLLFLIAGTVAQQCNNNFNMENMGGLIRKMPCVAWCALIACISASALPPFNGFISEWLILQDAFQCIVLKSATMRTVIFVAAALLALTSALALTCFVKFYSVIFLGQARTEHVSNATDPKFGGKLALILLSALCLLFGLTPTFVISVLSVIPNQLIGASLPISHNWFWLVPVAPEVSSYNAVLTMAGLTLGCLILYLIIRMCFGRIKSETVKPWDCGFGGINCRMQYTATAFAMPLRRVFGLVWPVGENIERYGSDRKYFLHIGDWIWQCIYLPLERLLTATAKLFARLQGGNIRVYLTCVFITLISLLMVIA